MTETPLHLTRTHRFLPAAFERALNSALSRGPGYEPTPKGERYDDRARAGYYIDFAAKTHSPAARDTRTLGATALIQLALGWWERAVAGDADGLHNAIEVARAAEARATATDDALRWPIGVAVPKYALAAPWFSALPQGQAASLYVRLHRATGEERYADLAMRAVAPLVGPRAGDLVTRLPGGIVLQEAPSTPPSHILNGWISALWGVWDVHVALGDRSSGEVATSSLRCLESMLPAYDTGWWSRYSLFPHAVEDLAKPIYHRFHVAQLEVLAEITGVDAFSRVAKRWRDYDRRARPAAAVAHKAVFALADSGRRRRFARRLSGR